MPGSHSSIHFKSSLASISFLACFLSTFPILLTLFALKKSSHNIYSFHFNSQKVVSSIFVFTTFFLLFYSSCACTSVSLSANRFSLVIIILTMVITATTSNNSLHQLQTFNSENNNNHLRSASFSSYLNNKEETFAESSNPFIINNRKDPLHQGVKKEEDGEIGVFDAEKYFNGGELETPRVASMDANKYQYQKDQQQTALVTRKYKVQHGTPSVRSESSLNSQSALLQSAMRNSSRNGKNQVQKRSILSSLSCKCSCSDKNSVDVNDHAGEISFNKTTTYGVDHGKTTSKKLSKPDLDTNHSVKLTKPHAELLINKDVYLQKPEKLGMELNIENSLASSTVSSSSGNQLVKMQLQQVEKARKSLEVFGSPILDARSKSLSFDKRLTLTNPSWDAAPKKEEIEFSENSGGNYEDAESDASSDLFEIESLTGKLNPFITRPTSNVASGCASPTYYAPSEASIEWSVVTASAVDNTAMSDYEDQGSVATIRSPIRTSLTSSNGKPKVSKEMQRRRPGKLLGCNSQKAVGVASDSFIKPSSNHQIRRKSDIFPQVTRFQVETKKENFGARHEQHAYATPPLRRSHSPHAPQLLYI